MELQRRKELLMVLKCHFPHDIGAVVYRFAVDCHSYIPKGILINS